MSNFLTRSLLGLVAWFSWCGLAPAQDSKELFDPKTPAQYWRAIQFEINLGSYDLAADLIQRFLDSDPSEEELYKLEEKEGLAAFLRLRNVDRWFPTLTKNDEARKNVETLIGKIDAAVKKQLGDTDRLARLIGNLNASEEEAAFAQKELIRAREVAIPVFASILQQRPDPELRAAIVSFLPKLDLATVPPLIALLDVNDPVLQSELLLALRLRKDYQSLISKAETSLVPSLWNLLNPTNPPALREQALTMLTGLLGLKIEQLSPAQELTKIANQYLNHKIQFNSKDTVALWKVDDKILKSTTTTIPQAEQLLAIQATRWALRQSPNLQATQRTFLVACTEYAAAQNGGDVSTNSDLFGLFARSNQTLLTDLLEVGVSENRTSLLRAVLAAIAYRGDRSLATETSTPAARSRTGILEKLLAFPDRRVQFQAAAILASLPGSIQHQSTTRVVEILRDAIRDSIGDVKQGMRENPLPRVLIADEDAERSIRISRLVESLGYRSQIVQTGRELELTTKSTDGVDILMVSATIPYPPLPDTLARLRTDVKLNALPLLVHYSLPDTEMASLTLPRNDAAMLNAVLAITGSPPVNRVVIPESKEDIAVLDKFTNRMELARQRVESVTRFYKRVNVIREPVRAQELRDGFKVLLQNPSNLPPNADEKKAQLEIATNLLCKMASGTIPGYPFKLAESEIRQAMRLPELTVLVLSHSEFFSSKEMQQDCLNIGLDATRDPAVQAFAVKAAIRHIQRYQPALSEAQIQSVVERTNASQGDLKTAMLALVGVLKLGSTEDKQGLGPIAEAMQKLDLNAPAPKMEKKGNPEKVDADPMEKKD